MKGFIKTIEGQLQPTQIALGATNGATNLLKLDYTYGEWDGATLDATKNNGNIAGQIITVKRPGLDDLVFNQKYLYDSLNRITSAEEKTDMTTNWDQTYTFDRYGNRNFDENLTTTLTKACMDGGDPVLCELDKKIFNPDLNPANNRMATGQGYTYDAAGNVVEDAEGRQFAYDAENKQVEVENSLSQIVGQYFFDGDGKRVKKIVPTTGEVTVFVYDAGAKLIGEYSTVIETTAPKVQYLTADHLGSPRINTDQNGQVTSRTDYMPYGEEIIGFGNRTSNENYTSDDVRQGFTGYENDSETGLDYAQARYFSEAHGRFTSTDPIYITQRRLNDPQQINLYAYVRNNPLTLIDPTGLDFEFTGKDKKKFIEDVNNRQDSQFKVKLNKNGIVEVIDKNKIDVNKLSKSEKAFFEAINDTENRATLTGVSEDAKIDFGGMKGDGVNHIDASDMSLLRKADKSVAGHVIAHEMMEAYASAKSGSNDYEAMHIEASKTFS